MKVTNNNQYSQTNFQGERIIRGLFWNSKIKRTAEATETPALRALLNGHDIVFRRRVKLSPGDFRHDALQRIYKIYISVLRENSFKDRILDFLHLKKRYPLFLNFHSKNSTVARLREDERYQRILKKIQK